MRIIRPVEVTDARLTASNAPTGGDPPEYDPGASYAAGDTVSVSATHRTYEALSNVSGVYPPDGAAADPPTWLDIDSLNPWAMFDGRIGTATTGGEPFPVGEGSGIQVEIVPGRLVNGLAFFGLAGASVRVEVIDPVDGIVYDRTESLVSTEGISNWWRYFFEPIERRSDLTLTDLPAYSTATLRISIQAGAGDARCGLLVLGNQFWLGDLQWGTSVGTLDFSRKERDPFGRPIIVARDTAKRANFDVLVDSRQTDAVRRMLERYTTEPLVWLGSELFDSTIIYGYYRDFDIVLANVPFSECTIEVEGLT